MRSKVTTPTTSHKETGEEDEEEEKALQSGISGCLQLSTDSISSEEWMTANFQPVQTPTRTKDVTGTTNDRISTQSIPHKLTVANLWNRQHFGILVSLVWASLLTSWLKRGVLTLMQRQLAMESYQVDAAEILLMLPWSSSLLWGFCSDIFPIRKSHRKSYMVVGWVLVSLAMLVMVLLTRNVDITPAGSEKDVAHRRQVVNLFVCLLGLACFGGILSVIVAEIYIIAQAKREELHLRGHIVGTFLIIQFTSEGIGQILTETLAFHRDSNGELVPLVSLENTAVFLVFYALVPIPFLLLFFDDHDGEDTSSNINNDWRFSMLTSVDNRPTTTTTVLQKIYRHWLLLWYTLSKIATWRVVSFLCLFVFFSEFTLRYPYLVLGEWCGVTSRTDAVGKIIAEFMYVLAVGIWRYWGLNRSWRLQAAISLVGVMLLPQLIYFSLASFGIGQNIVVYTFTTSLRGYLRGTIVLLEVLMIVEIAPIGGEGACLGAIVSIATIMRLISTTFSNSIGYLFGTQVLLPRNDIVSNDSSSGWIDSPDEDYIVFTALVLCSVIRLLALAGLLFMPKQKQALQELKRMGRKSKWFAWWTVVLLAVCVSVATLVNSFVITPETMCRHAFGGNGC